MHSTAMLGRRAVLVCVVTAVSIPLNGEARSERTTSEPGTSRTRSEAPPVDPEGRFPATVDRIVDGEYVVLLVEARGEVIAQYDVTRTTIPTVREGDRVLVTVSDATLTAVHTETGTRRAIDEGEPTAATW